MHIDHLPRAYQVQVILDGMVKMSMKLTILHSPFGQGARSPCEFSYFQAKRVFTYYALS